MATISKKLKGSEIIAMWNEANEFIRKIRSLGEIGHQVRNKGYDVLRNEFSVCRFEHKLYQIRFDATCFSNDNTWKLDSRIDVTDANDDFEEYYIPLEKVNYYRREIEADKEYDIMLNISPAEAYDQGIINFDYFVVYDEGGRTHDKMAECKTLAEAEEQARKVFESKIEHRKDDPCLRNYVYTNFKSSNQLAKEHGELRHYEWYNYQYHRYWVSVVGVGREYKN